MGVGTSLFLIAVGAILDFAVKVQSSHGINVNRIGLIILIVGIIGLIVSFFFWESWGGFGGYRRRRVVTTSARPYTDSQGRQVVQPPASSYVEEHEQY